MQKTLTPQRQSKDDRFVDNSEEDGTSCRQCLSEDDRFTTCGIAGDIDLLGSSEEELQQFTERLEKTAAQSMQISSDKKTTRQQHQAKAIGQYMDECISVINVKY